MSAEYNGHIIKFKDGSLSKILKSKSAASLSLKRIAASLGDFALYQGNLKGTFEKHPLVEYIEPNYIIKLDKTSLKNVVGDEASKERNPNLPWDTHFAKQWGFFNNGKNSASQGWIPGMTTPGVAGKDIQAMDAWGVQKGSRDVIIAVIDTGIDYKHRDLFRNMWTNDAELNGAAGVDDDGNGYVDDIYGYDFANGDADPMDGHSHGTHCAGGIGASHNSIGVTGVMANVRLMAIKFLSDQGSGELAAAISSIDYAVKMGAKVLSNSWGGGGYSQSLLDAIKRANDAGVLFVAAAGNDSADNDKVDTYPADYMVDNVVSVGAMNGAGKRAVFSNYGANSVHVFAPGENIMSTVPGNKYANMSGTSMAAPIVSGIAGLIYSQNLNLSPNEVKSILINNSRQSLDLTGKSLSDGMVNALDSVTAVSP